MKSEKFIFWWCIGLSFPLVISLIVRCALEAVSFLSTNLAIIQEHESQLRNVFVVSFLILFLYLAYAFTLIYIWHKRGRDPAERAVMPQYAPPKGMTAAQAAYLYNKGHVKDLIGISLTQLIANGLAIMHKNEDCPVKYIIERTGKKAANLEEDVRWDRIVVDGLYYNTMLEYEEDDLKETLQQWVHRYYVTNRLWVMLPTSIFVWLLMLILPLFDFQNLQFMPWGHLFIYATILSLVYGFCTSFVWSRKLSVHLILSLPLAIFASVLLVPLIEWGYFFPALIIGLTSYLMSFLLYQPTLRGQHLIEQLEGLKLFLQTTHVSKKAAPLSQKDLQKLFPYALALGMEDEYKEKCPELFELIEQIRLSKLHHNKYPGDRF